MASQKRRDKNRIVLNPGEFIRKEDGRYCYKYKDAFSGKYSRVYADNLAELREKEKKINENVKAGIDLQSAKKTTVNELFFFGLDLKEGEKTLRPSTRQNYEGIWRTNCYEFGKASIADVTVFHVRALTAELIQKGLSKSTIKLIHGLLSQVFDDGISGNLITINPCQDKSVKKARANIEPGKKRDAMTPEEQGELLEYVASSNIYNVYLPLLTVALYTGLRIGELTGLTWDDINFKDNTIDIHKQLKYKKTEAGGNCHFYFDKPKTSAGIRVIEFVSEVKEALQSQKRLNFMLGKTQKAIEIDGKRDFVFLNKNGMPYATNAINFVLSNIVKRHNEERPDILLPHLSAHIMRHTFITRAVERGVDYKFLQRYVGHSTIGVTMNEYAHPNDRNYMHREIMKLSQASPDDIGNCNFGTELVQKPFLQTLQTPETALFQGVL